MNLTEKLTEKLTNESIYSMISTTWHRLSNI